MSIMQKLISSSLAKTCIFFGSLGGIVTRILALSQKSNDQQRQLKADFLWCEPNDK